MFSLKIKYTLYGMILSASLITLVAQASTTDGVFGMYFSRMVGVCSTADAEVITGFDPNPSLFGLRVCTTLTSLLHTIGIDIVGSKVGLGEIAPDAKLEIAGPVDNMIRLNKRGSTNWNYIEWSILGTRQYWTGLDINGIFNIQSDLNNPVLINANGGDVGIGTSAPTAKLEVAGNIIADTPTASNHVATKGYVDSIGNSLRTLPILSNATVGLRPVSSGEFLFTHLIYHNSSTNNLQSANNNVFIGNGMALRFSTDNGGNWGLTGGNFKYVAYGAGRYVFIPESSNNGGYTNSLTLPNTTVTHTTLPFSATYNGIAYGAGRFVVVAQGHTPINSTDGITWNDPGTGPTIGTQNITWMPSASLFIIHANSGAGYHTSSDGITWTYRSGPVSYFGGSNVYINGAYYAKEYQTTRWYKTTDGISWALAGTGPTHNDTVASLTYYNGVYIMSTWDHLFTSTDFNKWISRDENVVIKGVISTNQRVYYDGGNHELFGSSDTVEGVFY